MKLSTLLQVGAAVLGLTGLSLQADPIWVSENGVGANETVWIDSSNLGSNLHVYAGVLNLTVDGTDTTGFCIDPWHWSSGSALQYNYADLSSAPKSANDTTPNPMGAQTALQIEQLWQQYNSGPVIDNLTAAALQIKIWQLVDAAVNNGTFELTGVDNGQWQNVTDKLNEMTSFLANHTSAPTADLIAVTGGGQDYVIRNVPDAGSTLVLLGLSLVGLAAVRRKHAAR